MRTLPDYLVNVASPPGTLGLKDVLARAAESTEVDGTICGDRGFAPTIGAMQGEFMGEGLAEGMLDICGDASNEDSRLQDRLEKLSFDRSTCVVSLVGMGRSTSGCCPWTGRSPEERLLELLRPMRDESLHMPSGFGVAVRAGLPFEAEPVSILAVPSAIGLLSTLQGFSLDVRLASTTGEVCVIGPTSARMGE